MPRCGRGRRFYISIGSRRRTRPERERTSEKAQGSRFHARHYDTFNNIQSRSGTTLLTFETLADVTQ